MRPSGVFDERYEDDIAVVRTGAHWVILFVGLAFLSIVPLISTAHLLATINHIGIAIIACHGLSILTGYTGQISIGQAAFMAVGAYTTGMLAAHAGWPFWATIPVSGLSAGAVGMVFGLPSLRVKGFYLALATLAAQFIIPWLIDHVRVDITGGVFSLEVPPPEILGVILNTQPKMFYLIMTTAVIMTFLAKNIARSGVGRAFIAIRDNDLAAEVMGVNPYRYKLLSFFVCSFFAGVAGALWAYWMRAINANHFTLMESVWYLGMIITGGMGSTAGAVFGAIYVKLLDELAQVMAPLIGMIFPTGGTGVELALQPIFFALGILLFIIFEPRGIAHRWEVFKAYYRLWPFSD
ncbi:MAG: branched-chain amino acid ABC transporter permease [Thermodesulfobacteriota bacterium]|nr:branched-chain amino acid ABC transporter permease [Thermodesulfobacteriota bacterium]